MKQISAKSTMWMAYLVSAMGCLDAQTVTRGPYLQMATETSMMIRWRSSTTVIGRVCYGSDFSNLAFHADENVPGTEHEIKLTGLSPSTVYYYSIGVPGLALAGGDDSHHFTTSPATSSSNSTRIWVIGDSGTGGGEQLAVRNAFAGFTAGHRPDLMLMLGDNAYTNGLDSEYQSNFFNVYPETLRQCPVWPTLGNHDTANSTDPNVNYPYFQMFTLPTAAEAGGTSSGKEHYYSFDRGNIHFVCLDSMTMDSATTGTMATWLQGDLAACTKTWIIAYWHHPPYSKGSHDSDTELPLVQMRTNILPILEAGGVDLVLCGHSHSYERSYLIDGHYGVSSTLTSGMIRNSGDGREGSGGPYLKPLTGTVRDHFGAVHVVAGSSGWLGGGPLNHPVMSTSMNELGSLAIDINGPRLDVRFIQPSGIPMGSTYAIGDSFTILKQANSDSDGDRIPDEYEILHNLDPHDPADALLDADNDGISNIDEYILETQVPPHRRVITHVNPQTKVTQVAFYAATGSQYRVFFSNDLIQWLPGSSWITGDDTAHAWTDDGSVSPHGAKRFYRVDIEPVTP
jgi:hypothetical protein